MKFILGMLVASLVFVAPSRAYEIRMTQGADSFIFDFPDGRQSIPVYQIDENEPYSDQMEGLMHDWFIIEDIFSAMDGLPKGLNLRMGRAAGIDNAFAAIRNNSRYIVIDSVWIQDHYSRIFVIGHELGHHVCGHTAGMMRGQPWDKELEADRFAGAVIRAMENKGVTTFQQAVGNAMEYLSENGSATHPPRAMRIQAALQGYNNGSPCLGREIASTGVPTTGGYSNGGAPPLWNHNGSTMRLVADGPSRTFLYQTPRAGLETVGVQSGTVLFSGQKNGDSYSGTAYVFSRNCGATAFAVSGPVAADQRSLSLYGKAPQRGANCAIAGYRDETLVFNFVGD